MKHETGSRISAAYSARDGQAYPALHFTFGALVVESHFMPALSRAIRRVAASQVALRNSSTPRLTCSVTGSPVVTATFVISARTSSAWDVIVFSIFCQ